LARNNDKYGAGYHTQTRIAWIAETLRRVSDPGLHYCPAKRLRRQIEAMATTRAGEDPHE